MIVSIIAFFFSKLVILVIYKADFSDTEKKALVVSILSSGNLMSDDKVMDGSEIVSWILHAFTRTQGTPTFEGWLTLQHSSLQGNLGNYFTASCFLVRSRPQLGAMCVILESPELKEATAEASRKHSVTKIGCGFSPQTRTHHTDKMCVVHSLIYSTNFIHSYCILCIVTLPTAPAVMYRYRFNVFWAKTPSITRV